MTVQVNTWNDLLSKTIQDNKTIERTLLVFGSKNSGKRTLVNNLQKISKTPFTHNYQDFRFQLGDNQCFSAVDYTYMHIKTEDYKAKINVYILDNPYQKDILQVYQDDHFFQKLIVAIVLDCAQPQHFKDVLENWFDGISEFLQQMKIPLAQLDVIREKMKQFWLAYQEPSQNEENNQKENIKINQTLSQGILEINFGFPIIIIQSKGDLVENIQIEKEGENKLNFIQYTLRSQSIQYGAGLITVSCKNETNVDVLYDYLLCLITNSNQKFKADLSQNNLFIPIGYDSQELISQTFPYFSDDLNYEDFFINNLERKSIIHRDEIVAEDNETFLQKIKDKIGGLQRQSQLEIPVMKPVENQDVVKSFYANLKKNTIVPRQIERNQYQANSQQIQRQKAEEEILNRLSFKSSIKPDKNIQESERFLQLIKNTKDK